MLISCLPPPPPPPPWMHISIPLNSFGAKFQTTFVVWYFFLTNYRLERSLYVSLHVKLKDWMSNSVDPDETAHYEPSHLDLCCLQKPRIIACESERVNWSNILNLFSDDFVKLYEVPETNSKNPDLFERLWSLVRTCDVRLLNSLKLKCVRSP